MSNPALAVLERQSPTATPASAPPSAMPGQSVPTISYVKAGGATVTRYMTLDDVVIRTAAMLAVIVATGAVSWSAGSATGGLVVLGALGGLGLGLYMAFTQKANAVTALIYAAFEGLLLGGISRAFEDWKPGVVVQAITGTLMVAVGVLVAYRVGAIRVTPRFTKMVIVGTFGVVALMFVNLLASLFVDGGLGLRGGGVLAIGFSLVCIALAAMNLVLDFDLIENSIRRGTDERFGWYCAFGLMVTLIWLYLEILRLLAQLRD
jgi:uncharacterized YccA/Bax inhibitor family protein